MKCVIYIQCLEMMIKNVLRYWWKISCAVNSTSYLNYNRLQIAVLTLCACSRDIPRLTRFIVPWLMFKSPFCISSKLSDCVATFSVIFSDSSVYSTHTNFTYSISQPITGSKSRTNKKTTSHKAQTTDRETETSAVIDIGLTRLLPK